MKLILKLSLTAVLTLVALATPPSVNASNPCPPNAQAAIRFYQADKDKVDHLYSTNLAEINDFVTHYGYKANGTMGGIFPTRAPGTIPLYRLYHMILRDHFYTSNVAEKNMYTLNKGYHGEGVAGYVLENQSCVFPGDGVVPLYRFYSSAETAHLLVPNVPVPQAGYVADGKVGYILV